MTRTSKTVTVNADTTKSISLTVTAEDSDRNDVDNATLTVSNTAGTTADSRDITIPTDIPDDKLALGTDPTADTVTFLPIADVSTNADTISITTQADQQLRDSLSDLIESGDVERVETAFGAFRRLNRGGGGSVLFDPPDYLRPPLSRRRVHPVGVDVDQLSVNRWEISLDLGLDRPRSRDPQTIDSDDAEVVDSVTLDLAANETASTTLTFDSSNRNVGDITAKASGPRDGDFDTTTVTLDNSDWTVAFGVGTLGLDNRQVGQITRESDAGIETISLPARLTASQVVELFAAGSRVAAVVRRDIADATNRTRDTLPDSDATADVSTPADATIDGGVWALTDWSISHTTVAEPAFEADLTFVVIE